MARSKTTRLGRPPASSATETRDRIIDVACQVFSEMGYGVTTNKDVANKAGITTGALYYYFDSKLDMYMAVFKHHQDHIDERMTAAMDAENTLAGKIRAVLEVAYEINVEDPNIARFQGTARIDRDRHPELRQVIPNPPGEGASLVPRLVEEFLYRVGRHHVQTVSGAPVRKSRLENEHVTITGMA